MAIKVKKNGKIIKITHLTFEEHDKVGAKLQDMRDYLVFLSCKLSNIYGKTKKSGLIAHKAGWHIDELRCELDNYVFQEYAEKPTRELTQIYYRRNREDFKETEEP